MEGCDLMGTPCGGGGDDELQPLVSPHIRRSSHVSHEGMNMGVDTCVVRKVATEVGETDVVVVATGTQEKGEGKTSKELTSTLGITSLV